MSLFIIIFVIAYLAANFFFNFKALKSAFSREGFFAGIAMFFAIIIHQIASLILPK